MGSLRGIAFRSVDHAIAVNDQVVELLDRYGVKSERLSLIPPFVARRPPADVVLDPRLDEFFNGRNPRLLSVSLLEPEYALDVQVAALGSVLKRFPNAGLLIAGGGSLLGQVKKLIDESPYRDHLFLAGDLDHDQTLRTIELADVLLRPTHYDGNALSIREALFLGTRVIATDNGMRPEGVALIPIPPDASHLARKIIETLEGGRNGTAPTDSDGRENIEAVISLYKRLLNGKEDA